MYIRTLVLVTYRQLRTVGARTQKNQTSVNLCLGTRSQKPAVRKIAMIERLHVFADSSWCLFLLKLAKLLLLSRERATFLLSINPYSLFNLNPSDFELQIKETGESSDQYSDARDC